MSKIIPGLEVNLEIKGTYNKFREKINLTSAGKHTRHYLLQENSPTPYIEQGICRNSIGAFSSSYGHTSDTVGL